MKAIARAAGFGALIAFAAFAANVVAGSFVGTRMLSDIGELWLLALAAALFVVLILAREKEATATDPE